MIDLSQHIIEANKQFYPTGRAWAWVQMSEQTEQEIVNFVDSLNNQFDDSKGNAYVQIIGSEPSPAKRLENAILQSSIDWAQNAYSLLSQILADNEEFDINDASNWERVFGLSAGVLSLDSRKANILRKQSFPNGVAERGSAQFIQEQLQAAGFPLYVHENRFWNGVDAFESVDPDVEGYSYTIIANFIESAFDNTFFDIVDNPSESGVAESGVAESGVPEQLIRTDLLKYTFYIGGETFPNRSIVPLNRLKEFRELVLKLKPAHTAAFTLIDYL